MYVGFKPDVCTSYKYVYNKYGRVGSYKTSKYALKANVLQPSMYENCFAAVDIILKLTKITGTFVP